MGQLKYRSLRGMPDMLPDKAYSMKVVEDIARNVYSLFAFRELRTPMLEATEVFTTGIGENTDIIRKEMYTFSDRSGKNISLRPEGTAPLIRAFIEHGFCNMPDVHKFFYCGPMFRGERPQKGRLRQFHQIGAEIIGSEDTFADIELILTLEMILRELELDGHEILVNSLGCADDREKFCEKLSAFLGSRIDELCEECARRAKSNVLRVLDCKSARCAKVLRGAPDIAKFLCADCVSSYEKLKDTLAEQNVPFREKKDLVRGLDYYTGVIFEVVHPLLGAQDAFAAGGRYDGLSSRMGGPGVGATGYAIGLERLLLIASDLTLEKQGVDIIIIPQQEKYKGAAFDLASRLRKLKVPCVIDLSGRSVKAQMRKAGKENMSIVVFVNGAMENEGMVSLKDMETGDQQDMNFQQLIANLKERKIER